MRGGYRKPPQGCPGRRRGALHLKNEHGVVMKLTSRTQGAQLNIASASGVKVTMK
jgi:hypothetical protein